MKKIALLVLALPLFSGCVAVSVAGAAVGTAASVTGTVVSTGVSVAGSAVKGTAHLVTGSN